MRHTACRLLVLGTLAVAGTAIGRSPAVAETPASPVVGQVDVMAPGPGAGEFGTNVTLLPNGNFVVADPLWDDGALADVGAVHLYDGKTDTLISTLTGSSSMDRVGSGPFGVTALANGNFVVLSEAWRDGDGTAVGAATLVDGETGLDSKVGADNSLVADTAGAFADAAVYALPTGNYVVATPWWSSDTVTNAGAVTFADGDTGVIGRIGPATSLTGKSNNDRISGNVLGLGSGRVWVLDDGDYLVPSPAFDHDGAIDAGAVTFGDGDTGVRGVVGETNSLVGASTDDATGSNGFTELTSGDYVVGTTGWDGPGAVDAGAVTFGHGDTGTVGEVGVTNSLVGSRAGDRIGTWVEPLTNGGYAVISPYWDDGTTTDAGAVTVAPAGGLAATVGRANSLHGTATDDRIGVGLRPGQVTDAGVVVVSWDWDDPTTGTPDVGAVTFLDADDPIVGPVTRSNSLVGDTTDDFGVTGAPVLSGPQVVALPGGGFVVVTPAWDGPGPGQTDVGAATWSSASSPTTGPISAANSLVGSSDGDGASMFVTALSDGDYVVAAPNWDWTFNGVIDGGAVTFGDGSTGVSGPISDANSLVGPNFDDRIGGRISSFDPEGSAAGVVALTNGNYVVRSPLFDFDDRGAVTFGDGTSGTVGTVGPANSLVGARSGDRVGFYGVAALPDGDAVALSPFVDTATTTDSGAVTWIDGETGLAGTPTTANSLMGRNTDDRVGAGGVRLLDVGHYLVFSPDAAIRGAGADAGAVTFGIGTAGVSGEIDANNSVLGTDASQRLGTASVDGLIDGARWRETPDLVGLAADDAAIVRGDDRVVLMKLDFAPVFGTPLSDVSADLLTDAASTAVTYANPVADDVRDGPVPSTCAPASGSEFVLGDTVVTCTATDSAGLSATASFTVRVGRPLMSSIDPSRLLETRRGEITIDGIAQGNGPVAADTEIRVPITGRADIPTNATAAIVNITAINPTGRGYLTIHDCTRRPLASNLNYPTANTVVGNEIITQLSPDGEICIYTSATTHLTADAVGYLIPTDDYTPIDPSRLLETRRGEITIDGIAQGNGPVAADTEIRVPITGRADIPANATAAIVNITAINPTGRGYLTIHDCTRRPLASNLNYPTANTVVGNEIITQLSPDGEICIYTSATTHLTADAVGYLIPTDDYTPIDPSRLLETRRGEITIDGIAQGNGPVAADTEIRVPITGRADIPANATAAIVNITAINPTGRGYLTIHDCTRRPLASNLNYPTANTVVGNEIITQLSPDGEICIYTSATTHLTADAVGYLT